jgi:hypothetical protein
MADGEKKQGVIRGRVISVPQPKAQAPAAEPESTPGRFLARSAIDALGSPLDLLTYPVRGPARALGFEMDAPTTAIADIMRGLGIGIAEEGEVANTLGEQVASGVGSAAGFLVPGLGAARAAQAVGGPVASAIGRAVTAPFTAAPVRATGAELAAGAAAGYGGAQAKEAAVAGGYGPFGQNLAQASGELLGGLTGAGLGSAVSAAGRGIERTMGAVADLMPVAGPMYRGAKDILQGIADPANMAFRQASEAVRGTVVDPLAAAMAVDQQSLTGLPPMLAPRESKLMELEQSLLRDNPELRALRDRQRAAATKATEEMLTGMAPGDVAATKGFFQSQIDTNRQQLDTLLAKAQSDAETALTRAGPRTGRTPVENSVAFRQELDKAYSAAQNKEKQLWGDVPITFVARTNQSQNAYRAAMERLGETGADLMSARATRFLDPKSGDFLGDSASVKEIQGLRSLLLEEARNLRASGNDRAAGAAETVAAGLLNDMDSVPGVGGPLEVARQFSRDMSVKFETGTIGNVLRTTKGGVPAVAPEDTLRRLLGTRAEPLAVRTSEMEAATSGSRPAAEAASEYMRGQFLEAAIDPSGQVKLPAAQRYVAAREDMLTRYPALGKLFDDAITAARSAQETGTTVEAQLADLAASPQAKFTGSKINREFDSVINSKNPEFEASELAAIAQQDQTGAATQGLRRAAVDYLLRKTLEQTKAGREATGTRLAAVLDDPNAVVAMSQFFSPAEMQNVRTLADELRVWQQSAGANVEKPNLGNLFQQLLVVGAGVAGARAGRAVSRGQDIQTPAIGASKARGLMGRLSTAGAQKLLTDAISDPDLMRALLIGRRPEQAEFSRAEAVLSLWMQNNMAQLTDDTEDPIAAFSRALGIVDKKPLELTIDNPSGTD